MVLDRVRLDGRGRGGLGNLLLCPRRSSIDWRCVGLIQVIANACPSCGYDLAGNITGECWELGVGVTNICVH